MPGPWWNTNWSVMNAVWQQNVFAGFFVPLAIWSLIWSGLALWHAAQRREKWWFIIFLLVHTAGILEIIYLFFVAGVFGKGRAAHKHRRS